MSNTNGVKHFHVRTSNSNGGKLILCKPRLMIDH